MYTRTNWEELATASHYLTATAIQTLLRQENWAEAKEGLDTLIAAMGRSEKQAVRSQLVRLMSHIIKWKCQPEKRSSSWAVTIFSARNEIADSQEEVPSINRSYLESVWEKCLARAVKQAELEMSKKPDLASLSWKEVFEDEYYLN
jgi:hypothetical protein